MKKLIMIILACILVMASAGLVSVTIEKGGKKYLQGAVGQVIEDAASLVDNNIPWAEAINLEVVKGKKSYLVYGKNYEEKKDKAYDKYLEKAEKYGEDSEKAEKYWEKYETAGGKYKSKLDGYRHAQLRGTITGDDGQQLEIIIDVDYQEKDKKQLEEYEKYLKYFDKYNEKVEKYGADSKKAEKYLDKLSKLYAEANNYGLAVSAVTVIGEEASLKRVAYGQKYQDWLIKETTAFAYGDFNAISSSTIWNGNADVIGNVYTQTGDMFSSEVAYFSSGSGSYNNTVLSDNYIYQKARTEVRP